jgi:hypothetical protein
MRPKFATLLKTGMDSGGNIAGKHVLEYLMTLRDQRHQHTLSKVRDAHHDSRTQENTANYLGDDSRLVDQPERVWERVSN